MYWIKLLLSAFAALTIILQEVSWGVQNGGKNKDVTAYLK